MTKLFRCTQANLHMFSFIHACEIGDMTENELCMANFG